ncbi:hypothetical protein O166_10035 [Pseudogulbenkiania ferrooxidans EGD-HP2]|uniref:Uncharacterized protein n=2 Tax=Chromobacteriaceae TaxID=1499392 RepID=A0ABP2XK92_9NEIS|nr:hypothetical protein O166_10035 [Pseudogulbenkiania ferrooxidans EGD-HP2]
MEPDDIFPAGARGLFRREVFERKTAAEPEPEPFEPKWRVCLAASLVTALLVAGLAMLDQARQYRLCGQRDGDNGASEPFFVTFYANGKSAAGVAPGRAMRMRYHQGMSPPSPPLVGVVVDVRQGRPDPRQAGVCLRRWQDGGADYRIRVRLPPGGFGAGAGGWVSGVPEAGPAFPG